MVNVRNVVELLRPLSMLRFFPAEEAFRQALLQTVLALASDEDQVRWIVHRIISQYDEWPGPATIYRLFESPMMPGNLKPLSKADWLKVTGGDQKQITDGKEVIVDRGLEEDMRQTLGSVAKMKAVGTGFSEPATAEEIASAPSWLRKLEGYE